LEGQTQAPGSGILGTFISRLAARLKVGMQKAASLARRVGSVLRDLLGFGRQ
jgi:hypothetical protein